MPMDFDENDDFKELDRFARQFFGMSFKELMERLQNDLSKLFGQGGMPDFNHPGFAEFFNMLGNIDPNSLPNVKSFRFVMKDGKPYFEFGGKQFNPFEGMGPIPQPQPTEKMNPDGTIEPYTETSIMEGVTTVVAELPGVEKGGVQVKLKQDGLFIKARTTTNDVVYAKLVPIDHVKQLDKSKIKAKITNGILEVKMPHLPGAQIDEDFIINID